MAYPFQNIALIGKYKNPDMVEPLLCLAAFLASKNLNVVVDSLTAEYIKACPYTAMSLSEIGRAMDLAIVLGGDGTMLNIARTLSQQGIPLIGVNQGRLGFLTDLTLENMLVSVEEMLSGKFIKENRLLLAAKVMRSDVEVYHGWAFNEVVIHRNYTSSMIECEVRVDGEYVYNQRADGLIITTPTGSTAYAMSAGGPILHPSLEVFALVPICPHTLSNRPIVINSSSVIEILAHRTSDIHIRFDSHTDFDLQDHDKIVITRHPAPVSLLHPLGHSYYHTLREKLLWNQTL